jgi:hypothetical protein
LKNETAKSISDAIDLINLKTARILSQLSVELIKISGVPEEKPSPTSDQLMEEVKEGSI